MQYCIFHRASSWMSTEFIENTPGVGEKASVRAPGSYKLSDEVLTWLSVCSKVDCLPMVQPVPLLSPNLVISWFFKIETGFYPRRYSTTVLAALCLSQVCVKTSLWIKLVFAWRLLSTHSTLFYFSGIDENKGTSVWNFVLNSWHTDRRNMLST